MREAAFIKKNKEQWIEFENELNNPKHMSPDKIVDLYVKVLNDLSYAKTYYTRGKTSLYLNSLASKAHFIIYKNKKESKSALINYWKYEIPYTVGKYHKELLFSFILFFLFFCIGYFSVYQSLDFARVIMGDGYIDMTIKNIKDGDPMGVYHRDSAISMFVHITTNNIRVGFIAFVSGILTPIMTIYVLFQNGVMLGTFEGFLVQYNVGLRANSIIWIHGVFEIFVIIVCGAAGLILGNSILFPKTFTRLQSARKGMMDGLTICISTLPFFVCAGFLESYVTRHSTMPIYIGFSIIIISIIIIIFYYIIYPIMLKKRINKSLLNPELWR